MSKLVCLISGRPNAPDDGWTLVCVRQRARLPLLLFTLQLLRAKREDLAKYGTLASTYVRDFDQKWLRSQDNDEQLLGTGDILSLAD